jgi:hypothetical protein
MERSLGGGRYAILGGARHTLHVGVNVTPLDAGARGEAAGRATGA